MKTYEEYRESLGLQIHPVFNEEGDTLLYNYYCSVSCNIEAEGFLSRYWHVAPELPDVAEILCDNCGEVCPELVQE